MKKNDHFWPSYTDLMTSLFFVMMILYILTFVKLKHDQNLYKVAAEKYEKLQEIEKSLSLLDERYFQYNKKNKRFRMTSEVLFRGGKAIIPNSQKKELKKAGAELFKLMSKLAKNNPNINFLIILEGNNARWKDPASGRWNYQDIPNVGYKISYKRALALYNFWKDSGYDFKSLDNCEILITGSGYFGKSRDEKDERKNKRFTIQITGKIGDFK